MTDPQVPKDVSPVGVYIHRKTRDEYVAYDHSVFEEDLAPLVHYASLAKQTRWSRRADLFAERFTFIRPATRDELLAARKLELVDWYAMSPEQQVEAIRRAPPVAGPWKWQDDSHDWMRDLPVGSSQYFASVTERETTWSAGIYAPDLNRRLGDAYPSADAAKGAVDEQLAHKGWRLILEQPQGELAETVALEAEKLLYSLGEYVRQTMESNPEWSPGVRSLESALRAYRKLAPLPPAKVGF